MLRRLLIPATLLLLIAACSSPAASSPDGGGGGGGGASDGSEPSAAASTGGGGGGGATTACDLITTDEVATVMGVTGVEAESLTGEPSYCTYTSGGDLVAATSFSTETAETVWAAYENDGPAVSGVGDKAVFSNSTGTLFFVSGSAIMGITAGPGSMDPAERQDLATQLGTIAAGRL